MHLIQKQYLYWLQYFKFGGILMIVKIAPIKGELTEKLVNSMSNMDRGYTQITFGNVTSQYRKRDKIYNRYAWVVLETEILNIKVWKMNGMIVERLDDVA